LYIYVEAEFATVYTMQDRLPQWLL